MSTTRSVIAAFLWGATLLMVAFLVFSGWWLFAPFLFASGGGGEVLLLVVAIAVAGTAAHLVGGRRGTRAD